MSINNGYPYIRPFPSGDFDPVTGTQAYLYVQGQFAPGTFYVSMGGMFFKVATSSVAISSQSPDM